MKFNYIVKYNGIYYAAGEDVPMENNGAQEIKQTESDLDEELEQTKSETDEELEQTEAGVDEEPKRRGRKPKAV